MQRQFDHKSEEFTLEKIIEFGFDQYAETIGDISGAATKELAIEQVRNLFYHHNQPLQQLHAIIWSL